MRPYALVAACSLAALGAVAALAGNVAGNPAGNPKPNPPGPAGKKDTVPNSTPAMTTETIFLAGGCFWGMEDLLRQVPGVFSTESGYTGGHLENPRYDDTHDSKSGHAEAVKVVYDPKVVSLETLLEEHFFKMHDPTTLNRQGNDTGTQYRSAIFYLSPEQKTVAEAVKARIEKSGKWKRPVATEITAAGRWWRAEEYHQAYLVKNPGGYTCHFYR